MRPSRPAALLVPVLMALTTPGATAQEAAWPRIEVHGRLQPQFYGFSDDNVPGGSGGTLGPASNFLLRRARFEVKAALSERLSFVVQPSYENPRNRVRLRDAFLDYRLTATNAAARVTLRAGQEKRPFGRYELLSSNNLPSIERGAGPGLRLGAGTHNLFESNGFLSHDVGAALHAAFPLSGRSLEVHAGVYNGQGESASDVNSAKSWGVRATLPVAGRLSVGASYFDHETATPDDTLPTGVGPTRRNQAVGIDAAWGAPGAPGLFVVADYMAGDDATPAARPIRGVNLVAAWHHRMGGTGGAVWALEPVLRYDRASADADDDDRWITLWSAGVGVYFTPRAHLRVMAERQDPADPSLESVSGVRSQFSVSF